MKLRVEKLQELIKQELSRIILLELKDPRLGFITVTGVELTGDLRNAKVYVSIMGSEEEMKNSWQGLTHAMSYMRREIGKRVRMRFTPILTFALDKSLDYSEHIQKLLLSIERENKDQKAGQGEDHGDNTETNG